MISRLPHLNAYLFTSKKYSQHFQCYANEEGKIFPTNSKPFSRFTLLLFKIFFISNYSILFDTEYTLCCGGGCYSFRI